MNNEIIDNEDINDDTNLTSDCYILIDDIETPTRPETETSIEIIQRSVDIVNIGGRPKDDIWQYYNYVDNGKGKHKGAVCKFCHETWNRGRAQDMKNHIATKCRGSVPKDIRLNLLREIQSETDSTFSSSSTSSASKKRKTNIQHLTLDTYYDKATAIDTVKEIRANKALIRWILCSGIPFSTIESPYFEDFTKSINFGYNPPKRAVLTNTYLNTEIANITLKMENELSKSKNLTLCIDGWSSPLKHSIYAFIVITHEKKQYVYSLQDLSRFSHTSSFNAEKIIEVLEKVGPEKFVAVVSDAEAAMMAAKRQVSKKYPHILPIRCIAHHIQLISSDICNLPFAKRILSNCQTIISFFRNSYSAGAALRDEIIRSFTTGGGLKSTTKTRWSTAWDSCESILRNESNLRSVLEQEPKIFNHANSIKNLIYNRQFWIEVEQLRNILNPVKRAVKNVEFRTIILADIFVELAKMAITIRETPTLINNQFRHDCIAIYNKRWKEFDADLYILAFFLHPAYRGNFLEANVYKSHVLKKALEVWKKFGGGRISADILKVQMSLYKNHEFPFDDGFIESIDTVYNWWISVDLKRNEDHIKTLAMKIHSITPHNAACERIFSVLSWYFGKRRNRLHIDRLEAMAQMHSFLIENAKSELNFINSKLSQDEFLLIFNRIADSINEETDLFDEDYSFPFFEDSIEENLEFSNENMLNLEIENFIDLSTNLDSNQLSNTIEQIEHGDKDFDIDELLND